MSQKETSRIWLNGEWVSSPDNRWFEARNPATASYLGRVADATQEVVVQAIESARRAFDKSLWRSSPRLRASVLLAFARGVREQAEALAQRLTLENGKPLSSARQEVGACVSELEYYAGLARLIAGRTLEIYPGGHSLLLREPSGVAAIIAPWNAPGILLVRSLAPALAAGCTAVIKTAPQTSLFSAALLSCLAEVPELPVGVVNSFSESGHAGAQTLVRSADVDVLAYTGSTQIGRTIMAESSSTLKRLCLELGGKAPCIVFPDVDIDTTALALVRAGTVLSGQQCTAASRILVQRSIATPLAEAMVKAMENLVVGDGMVPGTEMGPLIDQRSVERVERRCQEMARHGSLFLPVRRGEGALAQGAFLRPGLAAVQSLEAPGAGEEMFGPLLNLETFDDEDEAVHRANFHPYGLAASVWSRDKGRGLRVGRRVRSGTVWLNTHNLLVPEVETGGMRDSGFGRQHGLEGLDLFLQTRHIFYEETA